MSLPSTCPVVVTAAETHLLAALSTTPSPVAAADHHCRCTAMGDAVVTEATLTQAIDLAKDNI
jgi:hypothetical protein